MSNQKYMTKAQLGELLHVSPYAVNRFVSKFGISKVKPSAKIVLYPTAQIEAALESRTILGRKKGKQLKAA